jgi:hypothetical protein
LNKTYNKNQRQKCGKFTQRNGHFTTQPSDLTEMEGVDVPRCGRKIHQWEAWTSMQELPQGSKKAGVDLENQRFMAIK